MSYYRVWFGSKPDGVPLVGEGDDEQSATRDAQNIRDAIFGDHKLVSRHVAHVDKLDTGMIESHIAMKLAGLL